MTEENENLTSSQDESLKALENKFNEKGDDYVENLEPKIVDTEYYIIICESPGKEEVKAGTPLVGKTGKDVYKVLLNRTDGKSIGEYCKNNKTNIGIYNVCNFPMQKKHAIENDNVLLGYENLYESIESIRTSRNNFAENNDSFLDEVERCIYRHFKSQLEKLINDKEYKSKNIHYIPCGFFAKKFFEHFKAEKPNVIIEENVIYMPHPSYGNWLMIEKYTNSLEKIKRVAKNNVDNKESNKP